MNTSSVSFGGWLRCFGASFLRVTTIAGLAWLISHGTALAGETSTNAVEKAATKPADAGAPAKPRPKLTGVELYAIHCNRCHPERYPVEFNQAEWKTLMTHMRVRANLPAEQAREILKYLQEEAGD